MPHTPSGPAVAALACLTLLSATAPASAQTTPRSVVPPPRPAVADDARTPGTAATTARPMDTSRPFGRDRQGAVPDDYRLQVGDKLRIEVYKDAQLSQSVQIRPDGKITLPLVGDIAALGLSPLDLRERVAAALKEYVNNPVVTVIVVEGTSPTAYVVGEVNHPGPVVLQGSLTVLQALAVAGGLKDFADAKNIRILRKGIAGPQSIPFNYRDAIKGGSGASVVLQPGDTVVVPD
ncbi:MAG: polysaccharide biosynthesis/export family protein [Vicinamibacterales bacterium]